MNDEREFQAALDSLLSEAAAADIDVRGAWNVRDDDAPSGWTVEITEYVEAQTDSDRTLRETVGGE